MEQSLYHGDMETKRDVKDNRESLVRSLPEKFLEQSSPQMIGTPILTGPNRLFPIYEICIIGGSNLFPVSVENSAADRLS